MKTKEEIQEAVTASISFAETLRALGMVTRGSNFNSIKRRILKEGIDTSHFKSHKELSAIIAKRLAASKRLTTKEIMSSGKPYKCGHLKTRLYNEGYKERICEMCGQGEEWQGKTMSLILDHINGNHDDNRFLNLRILCPNCNATLDTHCRKKK